MRLNLPSIIFSVFSAGLISGVLTGCGPGFPVMTREQESLMTNVDNLVKDNETLKKRLTVLESGGSASATQEKKDIEDIKKSLAETNSAIDRLRQDFSFIQGRVEEADHESGKLKESTKEAKESVKNFNAAFASVNERLSAIDSSLKETGKKIDSINGSLEANDKRAQELKEAVSSLDKRTASLEGKVAGLNAATSAPVKKEAQEPEALYMKGYQEVVDKDYSGAAETFNRFLSDYPENKLAGNAQYWIGEIYYAKGDWERAILEFDRVVKKYPNSEKLPASLLKQGFAFDKLGSKKEARVLLGKVIEKFPDSPEASLAKKKLDTLK